MKAEPGTRTACPQCGFRSAESTSRNGHAGRCVVCGKPITFGQSVPVLPLVGPGRLRTVIVTTVLLIVLLFFGLRGPVNKAVADRAARNTAVITQAIALTQPVWTATPTLTAIPAATAGPTDVPKGTKIFLNKGQYTGELRNSMANGQGTAKYANGDAYTGEWKDDKKNGQGTYK